MPSRFDIVVIGAGPAGLCAARRIVQQSGAPKTLLIEKRAPWSVPVACAEGVGRLGFEDAIEPKKEWIRCEIRRVLFHSPANEKITYEDPNRGYIINRARMQQDLANEVFSRGVEERFGHGVTDVSSASPDGFREVRLSSGESVQAQVVIDCSGPLSMLGKQEAALEWKNRDLEVAYFAHIEGIDVQSDLVHLYMGRDIAPGGYAWAFPREKDGCNVGLVIGTRFRNQVNIRNKLRSFIDRFFKQGKITGYYAGTIPCSTGKRTIAVPGLIKAGDCAGTVNPISRAGIVEAMISGTLAGEYGLKMLERRRMMTQICKQYHSAWMQKRGKSHAKMAKVKSELIRIPDQDYDMAAKSLSSLPQHQLTMSRIFRSSLSRSPRLVWAMRHLM
ncbi:MAG: NAD(P)/FAD-dependent oxidoreductase [Fibrobacterota bacterium]